MYRLMVFVLLGMFCTAPVFAELAVAPAVEGMVAEAPADPQATPMGALPDEVPEYRGAQKPDMPEAARPPLPDTPTP